MTHDPHDRRSSLISATPAAVDLLSELRTRKTAFLARRLEALPPGDAASLAHAAVLLERLLADDGG